MLIELVEWWVKTFGKFSGAGLIQYISFRAGAAMILSLLISLLVGKRIIRMLQRRQIGETVRELGLSGQNLKAGTPTMGGVIIILSILVPCLLFNRLDNTYILVLIVTTLWMGAIGFLDDYIKVFRKNKQGLKGVFKVLGQVVLGTFIALIMMNSKQLTVRMYPDTAEEIGLSSEQAVGNPIKVAELDGSERYKQDYKSLSTNIPFLKGNYFDYSSLLPEHLRGWIWLLFVPFVILIVTAVSNAANLTDGLDGLCTGVSSVVAVTLGLLAYVSGNSITANYLNILHLPGSGEVVVFAACLVGACIGFLWYNAFPAQVFMGDTGSLTLGGIIAAMALLLRKEMLIPILCGVFLVESLSVIIQVAYFKYTKKKYGEGRRIFLMSPLHHHFQKKGLHEVNIVIRFTITAVMLAVITLVTLKIR